LDELVLLRRSTQDAGGDFDQGWTFVVLQRVDMAAIKKAGDLPDETHCRGMVYDVSTGLDET
jgi:hypothetical protein